MDGGCGHRMFLPVGFGINGRETRSPSGRETGLWGRLLAYPLMPVSEMPSMKVRWAKKKAMKMGSVIIVLAAIR